MKALSICFENDYFMVVEKPSGIAMHAGSGKSKDEKNIDEILKSQCKDFAPYLTHRLDKPVSGLVIIAKNRYSAKIIEKLFQTRKIHKEYITMVIGKIKTSGLITTDVVENKKSFSAKTVYNRIAFFGGYSLVKVQLFTGRKHQIRKHFVSIQHPIIMDDQYGNFEMNKEFKKKFGLKRIFLHSYRLKIPAFENMSQAVSLYSPLPKDLDYVLERFHIHLEPKAEKRPEEGWPEIKRAEKV